MGLALKSKDSMVMVQLLGGILLAGRMVPHPPPVNTEH